MYHIELGVYRVERSSPAAADVDDTGWLDARQGDRVMIVLCVSDLESAADNVRMIMDGWMDGCVLASVLREREKQN
jgi:hypothetical protein